MDIQIFDKIWESDLTTNAKIIAIFIIDSESEESYSGFPLVIEIMNGCSMSKTTVHKNLNLLLQGNWIIRGNRLKGSRRNYSINLQMLGQYANNQIQASEPVVNFAKEHFLEEFFDKQEQ